jgi:hypothetical protein
MLDLLVVATLGEWLKAVLIGLMALKDFSGWDSSPSLSGIGSSVVAIVYYFVMLAGMGGEYMFGLKKLNQFTFQEFVRPLWVSVIVFAVPWSLVDKSTITFGSILACYQNGFFWKRILESKNRGMTSKKRKI